MNNYEKISNEFIEEINSDVTIYSHKNTKARVCVMKNTDKNKVFSICFRTPPIDNTGLTHILEHSVLCGSKKYPVKDPFVELIKGSLNTFLNAFTFPDKTMYPVASMNDKDFNNLMSVYMDAVFFPNIYKYKEIFMQEGWHYDLKSKDDDLKYNGVVYNEMKGAFSDPEQVLARNIMHSLFPDTPYGLESGGDPKYIPTLTLDRFREFHKKYYHPSNSYIFLYGDLDVEERLAFLDKEYLSKFSYLDFDTRIRKQEPFSKLHEEWKFYPVSKDESLENKTYLSYNVSLGETLDIKRSIAYEILTEVLFNAPGAPIKEAILKSNICEDVDAGYETGILETYLSIVLRGSNKSSKDKFLSILNDSLNNVKVDKEAILASLNFKEFKIREAKFDGPIGLLYQMNALDSYLYSDDKPTDKLKLLGVYKELKDLIDTDYFDNLVKEIMKIKHASIVGLEPSRDVLEQENKELELNLKKYKESLSDKELDTIIEDCVSLDNYQSTPSTKEEIDTLPKLSIDDIDPLPVKYDCKVIDKPYKTYYSDYFTNGISYITLDFNIKDIAIKDSFIIKLLSNVMFLMNTDKYTYNDINKFIKIHSGGIYSNIKLNSTIDEEFFIDFSVKMSSKDSEIKNNLEMIYNCLLNTIFDEVRLTEIVNEAKNNLNQSVSGSAHQVALLRAGSYVSKIDYISDLYSGINNLDNYNDANRFKDKRSIITQLKEAVNTIFTKERFSVSVTTSSDISTVLDTITNEFYNKLPSKKIGEYKDFDLVVKNEGIKTPYNVNFVARASKLDYVSGALFVLKNAISLDYLWDRVRVHGGAYGCMIRLTLNGRFGLTSYRDPNIKRTNDCYLDLPEFIKNLNPDEDTLLKYKIGAISTFDQPLHASSKGEKAISQYISKVDYEFLKNIRNGILNATKEELNEYSSVFQKALDNSTICVVGNSSKVEEDKDLFMNVRNLIKN